MRYPWSLWTLGEIWVGDRNTSVIGVKTVVEFMRFDVTHQLEHFGFFPVERIKKSEGERIMDGVETSFREKGELTTDSMASCRKFGV